MANVNQNVISGGIFLNTVIQGEHINVMLPPEVKPALSVPAGSQSFTGRQPALREVLSALAPVAQRPGAAALRAVSLSGMAGIGKTELAIQASRAAREAGWFPGGVLLINLFGYDPVRCLEPARALGQLLRDHLGLPAQTIPASDQGRARLYEAVLDSYAQEGRPILVIIDNASSAEQAKPFLPADTGSGVIVTSRETLGMLGVCRVDLDVLPADEAVELLRRAVNVARPGDSRVADHPDDAREIARLCADLPQALQIVGALLADNSRQSLSSMAADLSDSRSRLAELSYQGDALASAFQLSYERLEPEQALIFRLLPVSPGPDVSTQSAAVLAGLDKVAARHALRDLAQASLLMYGSSDGRWRLHDLIRLFADEQGRAQADGDHRNEATRRLLGYFLGTATAASQRLTALGGVDVPGFPDAGAALAWLDAERACLVAAVTMARQSDREKVAAQLALAPAAYFEQERRFDDALVTTTAARDIGHDLGDRATEASALASLVMTYQGLRRFDEAIGAGRQSAQMFKEAGNRVGQAAALTNLGGALQQVRKFDEAVGVLGQASEIYHELGNSYAEAVVLINLGGAQRGAGRSTQAIIALQTAANLFEQYGDRRRQAMALTSLSGVLFDVARYGEAITRANEAATICNEIGDRHGEGEALSNLAGLQTRLGQAENAVETAVTAVAAFRATADRYREAQALVNLASAKSAADPAAAIAYYQQARPILEQAGALWDLGPVLAAIGGWQMMSGSPGRAIAAFRQAVVICQQAGDVGRQGAAQAGLGHALALAGRIGEAAAAFGDAVQTLHAGGDQQGEAGAAEALSQAQVELRRTEDAIAAQRGQADRLHSGGDGHAEGLARNELGGLLLRAGHLEEALDAHRNAASILRDCGDPHGTAMALGNIGRTLAVADRPAEAAQKDQEAADLFGQAGDLKSEAMALENRAQALEQAGRLDEAVQAWRAVGGVLAETGDPRSQAMLLDGLGRTLQAAGRPDQAAETYTEAVSICRRIGDQQGEAATSQHLADATAQAELATRLADQD
jgi:tetratricopeptide (TPR) repeat protein